MQNLSHAKFEALIAGAKVLERQEAGLSALRTPDRKIIKIWQRRPGLTSDRIRPYSQRFKSNCEELNRRGITAPVISEAYRVADSGEHVLVYQEIPGTPLKALAEKNRLPIEELAGFYARLHHRGVHFRSIHLGNVLYQAPGEFALIDVVDTRFTQRPLSLKRRAENLGYAWAYRTDYIYFDADVRTRLIENYEVSAKLSASDSKKFREYLALAYAHYDQRRIRRTVTVAD